MKESTMHHPLIILGTGPAGYAAGLYAARANLHPVIITGSEPGGQLMNTTDVGNWPGGSEDLQGPHLMQQMKSQVERFNVTLISAEIQSVELTKKPFYLKDNRQNEYTCDALIIATGAQAKYLGLPSESKFYGKGVSACATCDGFLYRQQTVAVVGGGNTAVEEALYLSKIAKHTILIHRREQFRADKLLQQQLFERVKEGRITLYLNCVIDDILGNEKGVTHINVKQIKTQNAHTLKIQCLFVAIGHRPNTHLFENQLILEEGYIKLPYATSTHMERTMTSVQGVFAAGDVADSIYRQAITSSGSGCMAALDAARYLDQLQT